MGSARRNGFYRSLGLTKSEFYAKLGGRAGGEKSAEGLLTHRTPQSSPPSRGIVAPVPGSVATGQSQPFKGLTFKRRYGTIRKGGLSNDYTKSFVQRFRKALAS